MAAESLGFHEMGLDERLIQAIAKLNWAQPTLIQEKAIPLALEGKDLLARARTGSGKTAAYAIPIIEHLLNTKKSTCEQAVRAVVLVPTKELGQQVQQMIRQLTSYCTWDVRVADVSGQVDVSAQRPILMEKPDIVIGTPSRVLLHLEQHTLSLCTSLEMLVIDEADLVFSFGFENDLKNLLGHLPKIYQAFLMSATFNEDVQALKELVLHNPVILKLQESRLPDSSQLTQYRINCEEEEKFLLIYTLLKLSLIRGKTIIFVNSIDRCYRLKLFLEQFSIFSCVLNSELPIHSRCHIIGQFNRGFYDYVIATDEHDLTDAASTDEVKKKKKNHSKGAKTARVDNQGTALTFVSHTELPLLQQVEEALTGENMDCALKPYRFRIEEIEGFRYRCKDAMRSVTKQSIKEARLKEIRQELLNSEKLKTYFEDNPRDLQLLRHDKPLHPAIVKPHLKNVPDYLVPQTLKAIAEPLIGKRKRWRRRVLKDNTQKKIKAYKKQNPLKNFTYTKKRKMKSAN
ncbi:probable ATP-dependent RNA helicase DDX56 isoform X2 [Pristis pectinata]|uniref:probable ATP-dependent RNA helicase DDX56 isoform X2 n=1 Tax=Pristis pectinata TaxID=685728 RepID=UPI00223DFCDD|nr:probable ATP-dependent RNA helicase DDX56 isoform X2 [Pristis pectinata]